MSKVYFRIRGDGEKVVHSWNTKTLYVNEESIYSGVEVERMFAIGAWILCEAPIKTKNSVKRPTDNWKKTISKSKWLRCVEDENCFVIDSLDGIYYNPETGFIYRITKNCNNEKIYVSINLRKVSMLKDSGIAEHYDKLVEDYYDNVMKMDVMSSCHSKEGDSELFEDLKESLEEIHENSESYVLEINKECEKFPVKSDGGDSKYYHIPVPEWFLDNIKQRGYTTVEDLAEIIFKNDANFFNTFKAQCRMFDLTQGGGKEGNTFEYDATKSKYYIDKQVEVFNR